MLKLQEPSDPSLKLSAQKRLKEAKRNETQTTFADRSVGLQICN